MILIDSITSAQYSIKCVCRLRKEINKKGEISKRWEEGKAFRREKQCTHSQYGEGDGY